MEYDHKDEQLHHVKRGVDDEFRNLHPTDRAKAFGELSEWASQRRDGREQINARDGVPERPVLDEVHVDQPLTKIHVPGGAKEKTSVDTGWDNPPGDMLEDLRKMKAVIKSDTGLKPSYVMSAEAKKYYDQAAKAQHAYAQQYWNDFGCDPAKKPSRFFEQLAAEKARLATRAHEAFVRDGNLNSPLSPQRHCCDTRVGGIHTDECSEALKRALKHEPTTQKWMLPPVDEPLYVIGESVSWAGLGEKHLGQLGPKFVNPRVTCRCKGLTGVRYKVGDRMRVQRSHGVGEGIVSFVHYDNTVSVRLDAELPPAISPKEARARSILSNSRRITCDPSNLNIDGRLAYTSEDSGAYIGRVVEWRDDGMVVIEVAPTVNEKAAGDVVTPNADTKANVAERCEECKGTGTWTSPFTNETSPCSRGCKS